MPDEDVIRLEEQVKTLFTNQEKLEKAISEINKKLTSWLPLWATALIGLLFALLGYYVKN